MIFLYRTWLCVACGISIVVSIAQAGDDIPVLFAARGPQSGVYQATLNLDSGKLSAPKLAVPLAGVGFLAMHPDGMHVYATCRTDEFPGAVATLKFAADRGSLEFVSAEATGDRGPTHLTVSRDGQTLLLVDYGGGSVVSFPIAADRTVGPRVSRHLHEGSSINPQRQQRPHPHWIGNDPSGRYVLVPDLGTDQIVIYRLDENTHAITPVGAKRVPPGSGPRHFAFHPNGKWGYVANELSLAVIAYQIAGDEEILDERQSVLAVGPDEVEPILTTCSEIQVHPSGRFLYVGIRGHDTIGVFAIDPQDGTLSFIEREPVRGSWPRHFGIDPTGRWLLAAGQESDNVAVFRIDQESGDLIYTRNMIHLGGPTCVLFVGLEGEVE